MASPASHAPATHSRKAHRKSRLGCGNCKRRKIKCDEQRPACGNCGRHTIVCDYSHSPPSAPSPNPDAPASDGLTQCPLRFICSSQANFTPPKRRYVSRQSPTGRQVQRVTAHVPCTAIATRPFQFSAVAMALFHHLMCSAELRASYPSAQGHFTRLGFSFHYLLHLLLAFSAFHLSRNHEAKTRLNQIVGYEVDCHAEGERHYSTAVRAVAEELPLLSKDNGLALFASAVFVFICSIARGPQDGEFLAFRTDGQAGSLSLFMGVRSILETCTTKLCIDASVVYSDESTESAAHSNKPSAKQSPRNAKVRREYTTQLEHLNLLLDTLDPSLDTASYHQTFERLRHAYHLLYRPDCITTDRELWPVIFAWLYTLPDPFLLALQHREPVSLVIFAFFAVLLKELDSTWFIAQWPEHVMQGILSTLDTRYRRHISWPMEVVRSSAHLCRCPAE
ncbi:hypothetical protein BJY00DRAFT_314819 [Aspergillus carlsbadensis]|nr:hypothetical protein BJY00DRAFT_314819 [Aspergillus carlsbadensis]